MKTTQEIIRLLKDFKAAHAGQYGILRMGIFGSVAREEQTEDSDVDIYYEQAFLGVIILLAVSLESLRLKMAEQMK